ncbi:hypothetical protein RND59_07455 [Vibrio ruber]|uniref:hypothetical protein n=1 Tax=Vibrio ruber TaxID=184755 RepID=UPI002892E0B3|nr:hypothetical protein [Vibrio ruber]WNJ96891.1 hypothetical protein RND59_07455 [Vibrio ruber]
MNRKNILGLIIAIPFFALLAFDFTEESKVDKTMLFEFQQILDHKINRNSSYQFVSGAYEGIPKSGRLGKFYSCLRQYQLFKHVRRDIPEMMGLKAQEIVTRSITMQIDNQLELQLELSNAVVTGFVFGVNGDYSRFASYCELKLLNHG